MPNAACSTDADLSARAPGPAPASATGDRDGGEAARDGGAARGESASHAECSARGQSATAGRDADANVIAVARDEFESLLRGCAGLTAPKPLEERLSDLLVQVRRLVHAQAGAMYVVHQGRLRFICSQNDADPHKCHVAESISYRPWAPLKGITLAIDANSLSGYVALTAAPLNIPNVREIPGDAPYRFNADVDLKTGFITRSVLGVPLIEPDSGVLGVLQVINRLGPAGAVLPFAPRDVQIVTAIASMAAMTITNSQLNEDLLRSHMDTILRLSTAAEYRDGDTGQHIRRMSCYCEAIARQMGATHEWARRLLCASPMHDVGKIGIPDAILMKPGPLSAEERRIMQSHTVIGARILDAGDSELLQMACRIARGHHERWDGAGYPDGLRGDATPLEARIAGVADVFDALTNRRVYKPPFTVEAAFEMMQTDRGKHFDPDVLDAFTAAEENVRAIYEAYQPA